MYTSQTQTNICLYTRIHTLHIHTWTHAHMLMHTHTHTHTSCTLMHTQGHTASISAVARSLRDNYIVSGADNGQILLHATTSTQPLANLTKDHRDKDSSSKQVHMDLHVPSSMPLVHVLLHYNLLAFIFPLLLSPPFSPLTSFPSQAVTQLAFSHHDRALIGSSAEDGSVCLWSTESQHLLTTFSQKHAGTPKQQLAIHASALIRASCTFRSCC